MINRYYAEFFVINFIIFLLSGFRDTLFAENHLFIWERTLFDFMQKSPKFLLEIMALVPSANIMNIDGVFSIEGRSFNRLWKEKAAKLTPQKFHALFLPRLNLMISFRSFVFYLLGRIWTNLLLLLEWQINENWLIKFCNLLG
jgi:hypothetical protein